MKSTKQHQTTPLGINDDAEGCASECRVEAKADLAHGEWLPFLREVGMSARVAQEFMSIGSNTALTNASNCAYLPTAARALYELSRLDADDIEHGIETGAITPKTTIEEAREYAAQVESVQLGHFAAIGLFRFCK